MGLQDNEDDLLYGDLSDAGAAASGKEAQTEAQDQDKGEGAGEEDLELNLYEVGDKEDEDDSRSSGGRRGLERERYPAGGDRPQQNKVRCPLVPEGKDVRREAMCCLLRCVLAPPSSGGGGGGCCRGGLVVGVRPGHPRLLCFFSSPCSSSTPSRILAMYMLGLSSDADVDDKSIRPALLSLSRSPARSFARVPPTPWEKEKSSFCASAGQELFSNARGMDEGDEGGARAREAAHGRRARACVAAAGD